MARGETQAMWSITGHQSSNIFRLCEYDIMGARDVWHLHGQKGHALKNEIIGNLTSSFPVLGFQFSFSEMLLLIVNKSGGQYE